MSSSGRFPTRGPNPSSTLFPNHQPSFIPQPSTINPLEFDIHGAGLHDFLVGTVDGSA